jgi:hypothetical protein
MAIIFPLLSRCKTALMMHLNTEATATLTQEARIISLNRSRWYLHSTEHKYISSVMLSADAATVALICGERHRLDVKRSGARRSICCSSAM